MPRPKIDLFHQLFYESPEGFYAIINYTGMFPRICIYTPDDEYFGGTTDGAGAMSITKGIIKDRIKWEKRNALNKINE